MEGYITEWREKLLNDGKMKLMLGGVICGILIIGAGIWWDSYERSRVKLEYLPALNNQKLVVDVQGAVEKPGVYELTGDVRLKDVLVACGGLSAEADREYVSMVLNMAEKIKDGEKIIIPKVGEKVMGQLAGVTQPGSQVNINKASAGELDKLKGVGAVTAQKIIEGRPYKKIEELLERKIVSKKVFEENKNTLSVY